MAISTRRAACRLLAAAIAVSAAACGTSAERASESSPAARTSSKPPSESLRPLVQLPLPGVKRRTFTSAIVDFPPAARAAPHRHGAAFVYAYVLKGTIASRLAGKPRRTYRKGESWVEQPGADHVLTENTSRTAPARLLVVFISHTGDKLKVDDPPRSR